MHLERRYHLTSDQAVTGIEKLADSFIDPNYRQYTVRGLAGLSSTEPGRKLLPKRYRRIGIYEMLAGTNSPVFISLLKAAQQVKLNQEFGYSNRLYLADLVQYNLTSGENVYSVLKHYCVLGRDDYLWYLFLGYQAGVTICSLGDNTVWDQPDSGFTKLYDRYIGDHFSS